MGTPQEPGPNSVNQETSMERQDTSDRSAAGDWGAAGDRPAEAAGPTTEPRHRDRERARRMLEGRRRFRDDAAAYVVTNVFLVIVWALTGAGYFWPAWVMIGWGILLAFDGWNAHFRRPVSDDDVDSFLRRAHDSR